MLCLGAEVAREAQGCASLGAGLATSGNMAGNHCSDQQLRKSTPGSLVLHLRETAQGSQLLGLDAELLQRILDRAFLFSRGQSHAGLFFRFTADARHCTPPWRQPGGKS